MVVEPHPAHRAACLAAIDPGLGGLALRAGAGPQREAFVDWAASLFPNSRRLPHGAGDDRLFGGLDLAATLQSGRPVHLAGLAADAAGALLIFPMAERMSAPRAARLAQAADQGAGFAALLLDEAEDGDAGPPDALCERLAFWQRLIPVTMARQPIPPQITARDIANAQARLGSVRLRESDAERIIGLAAALGIPSLRAPLHALRAARALAAVEGLACVNDCLLEEAAALVLAPRARTLPEMADEQEEPRTQDTAPPPDPHDEAQDTSDDRQTDAPPEDQLLEAVRAAIPPDLLARLAARGHLSRSNTSAEGAGDDQKGTSRGRPAGTRRGDPRSGARMDLVATLRTAAPWQPLRRRELGAGTGRVLVKPEDFRIRQYRRKTEKVVIFVVDASGSAAMARLGETKGAIELMLAEAYVRREQVALIAFRGTEAQLLLPPTRSLVQAKRRLTALPGGGGTPVAAGLEAALTLALHLRQQGKQAQLAILTDGRANIGRNGNPGRPAAVEDATQMARAIRANGIGALLIDTGSRPQPLARALAGDMDALYLPMPMADAHALAGTVSSALSPAKGAA